MLALHRQGRSGGEHGPQGRKVVHLPRADSGVFQGGDIARTGAEHGDLCLLGELPECVCIGVAGVAVVQNFDKWATQVYFQFRNFSLDTNDDPNVSDINVGTLGARVKF